MAYSTVVPRAALTCPGPPLLRHLASLGLGSSGLASQRQIRRPLASGLFLDLPRYTQWSSAVAAPSSHGAADASSSTAAEALLELPSAAACSDYLVINFYHLVDIEKPHAVIQAHKEFLQDLDVRGRIYFSEQGVNAQFGGPRADAVAYAEWATTQPPLQGVHYEIKLDSTDGHQFPRLRVQYKPNLISLSGGMAALPVTDPAARATPLKPAEWRRFLEEGVEGRRPLVLDVRNSYEWDAGHFVGAQRPLEDEFNETPTESTPADVPAYLRTADPGTPVMMYCTGGIRCDVYSTYLKQKGYQNLYTLEMGVQNYMKEEGLAHWNGSCYVFDGRMAIRQEKGENVELEAAAPCGVCGGTAVLPHANCANIDCNKLFIACDACRNQLRGCCCEACMDAPRLLRPVKTTGQYGTWTNYAGEACAEKAVAIVEGRGEGRISRRRKWQQALKEREQAKRVLKVERRRQAKAAMAAVAEARGGSGDAEQDEALDKMARLRELRERLRSSPAAPATAQAV